MSAIVDQHIESFVDYGCTKVSSAELITPSGQTIWVATWQSLAAAAGKRELSGSCGYLVFDECHVGGQLTENRSFRKIMDHLKPELLLNVSATIQPVSEQLLGVMEGHTYSYLLSRAYQDELLNPVDLVEVEAGTRSEVVKLERQFGQSIEELEELSAESLEDLAAKFEGRQVTIDPNSVRRVVQHRHDVMTDLYLAYHKGEQAIFYSPSIEAAEDALRRLERKASSVRAAVVHSKVREDSRALLGAFRSGALDVLFAVGMLQEGFDVPRLRLAFDCRFYRAWNMNRLARLTQKMGRVMRIVPGKPPSKYYFARDITDFYRAGAAESPEDWDLHLVPDAIVQQQPQMSAPPQDNFGADAAVAAAAVFLAAEGPARGKGPAWSIGELRMTQSAVRSETTSVGLVRSVSTALYALADVHDGKIATTVSLARVLGRPVDEKKAAMLALPLGSPRPHRTASELGQALSNYTSKGCVAYDPDFDQSVRAAHPGWFDRELSARKKAELLAMPPGAARPRQAKSALGRALTYYTAPSASTYDPEFDAAIRAKQPGWFASMDTPRENKKALMELKPGEGRPHYKSKLGVALANYVCAGSTSYDEEFAAAVRLRHPRWFGKRSKRS